MVPAILDFNTVQPCTRSPQDPLLSRAPVTQAVQPPAASDVHVVQLEGQPTHLPLTATVPAGHVLPGHSGGK